MADSERLRFFILTPGRTGSSLLGAILADAGADFGIPAMKRWDPTDGGMEHPAFAQALGDLAKAERLSEGRGKPVRPLDRAFWSLSRHRGRHKLDEALRTARFVKAINADLAIEPALRLGYTLRLIVSYRKLEPHIVSHLGRSGDWSVDMLTARYTRMMRNGLAAICALGGCVVSFEELQDKSEAKWAKAIAAVTSLDMGRLLAARERLAGPPRIEREHPCLDSEADRLWGEAESMKGRVFAPHHTRIGQQPISSRDDTPLSRAPWPSLIKLRR